MEVLRTVAETQARCLAWRAEGRRIGLVPTMGYLHEGHLSLVRVARQHADTIVATIFVNPTQFGPNEDLSRYPRDEEGDLAKLRAEGTDLVFCPPREEVYPPGYQTYVQVEDLTQLLCGRSRPVHFRGVTTVVSKLFLICQPHVAVFGEKDFQQLQVLRRMTRDLGFPVEVLGGPLVREADGLAMSSRNAYLSPDERRRAPVLYASLQDMAAAVRDGGREVAPLVAAARERIETAGGRVDYLEVVDTETLSEVATVDRPARAALAVFFGRTRLIDNVALEP